MPVAACVDPPRGPALNLFTDVTKDSGVDFEYESPDFKGGGLAVVDLDGDGRPDIVATRRTGGVAVFFNRGGLRFAQATATGIDPTLAINSVAAADLDNDGDADLVLAGTGTAYVYANNGDGTFTKAAEFDNSGRTEQVLPVDINGDGLLDLFVSNYDLVDAASSVSRLYLNLGGLTFTPTPLAIAGATSTGATWATTAFDADGDGDQDLYLANDTLLIDFGRSVPGVPTTSTMQPDLFLRNDGIGSDGAPHFTNIAPALGLAQPRSSMGGLLADFDGDGQLDLYVPNDGAKKLFVRDPATGYDERAAMMGVEAAIRVNNQCSASSDDEDCVLLSWSAAASDFDLDGYDELLVVNGVTPLMSVPPVLMFERGPQAAYHEVSPDISCIDGHGLVVTDLDGDGDQDIAIAQNNGPLVIYETRGTPDPTAWLRVRLQGTTSNRDGIGALVTVTMASGRTQQRVIGSGGVINSALVPEAFFGLGADPATRVTVQWPSGRESDIAMPGSGELLIQEP